MKEYGKRFNNINQKDAETEVGLRKEKMSILNRKRLECLYQELKIET
jgi:hypothetical protein